MPDAIYADPSERLPWLPNAPRAPQPQRWAPALLAAAAAGAIALGAWAWLERSPVPDPADAVPARTVPLPAPSVEPQAPAAAEPEAESAGERDALRPAAASQAEPAGTKRAGSTEARQRPASRTNARKPVGAATRAAPAYDPRAWRSGIPGRIIQLGAFASSAQAQREWRRVYYRYPLLRPLSPRVIKSKIRGRTYYRLQLGTFSQAHSELLCQRLRKLGEGCMVLGLRQRGRQA